MNPVARMSETVQNQSWRIRISF